MDLSLSLLYSCKLTINHVSGTYPSTDNCYSVTVTRDDGTTWVCDYCPKPVFEMWKLLFELRHNKTTVKKKNIEALMNVFNEYGDWKYEDASINASMEENESL